MIDVYNLIYDYHFVEMYKVFAIKSLSVLFNQYARTFRIIPNFHLGDLFFLL